MRLGATEKQLKTYNYYQTSDDHSGTLVVTDRRLVRIERSKHGESHSEIRIKDIASIDCGYHHYVYSPAGLVLMILGVLVAAIGAVLFALSAEITEPTVLNMPLMKVIGMPVIALGAILLIIGLVKFLAKRMAMYLIITSVPGQGERTMDLYVSNKPSDKLSALLRRMKGNKRHVRMSIDKETAMDLVNELSSIVWEVQATGTAPVPGCEGSATAFDHTDTTSDIPAASTDILEAPDIAPESADAALESVEPAAEPSEPQSL